MSRSFDLLGDPIPENHGNSGANGHIATAENVNKVRLLVVANWSAAQIAGELGISVPTLNKHYFQNRSIKRAREISIAEAKGRALLQLSRAADDGNVSAQKELLKIVEKEDLARISGDLGARGKTKPKAPKPGKKEAALEAAKTAANTGKYLPDYGKGKVN